MTDRVGQQLGNYRLISLLGRGSFAEVYLGEHVYLETQAAIKVLHTQLASADIEGGGTAPRVTRTNRHPGSRTIGPQSPYGQFLPDLHLQQDPGLLAQCRHPLCD